MKIPPHFLTNKFASSIPSLGIGRRSKAIEVHTFNCCICGRGYFSQYEAQCCYNICSVKHCIRCDKEFVYDFEHGLFSGCTEIEISPSYGSKFDCCKSYFETLEEIAQLNSVICDECLEQHLLIKQKEF